MFQLKNHSDKGVSEIADFTFYTPNVSVCLVACFDFGLCKVAVYQQLNNTCQIFTTQSEQELTFTDNPLSDVYYRTCKGKLFISPEHIDCILIDVENFN